MACEKHGYTNNVFCPACDLEVIEFQEWLDKLKEHATNEGYELKGGYMLAWERAQWQELFEEGLTPQKAWEKA